MKRWPSYSVELRTLAALALAMFAFIANAEAGPQPHFVPHRAVYEFELTNAVTGSGVAELEGRMVYELQGSVCEGYTQNTRFVTRMTNQEGDVTLTDLRNSSWEDALAKRLRFSASQYANQKRVEASAGDAKRSPTDGTITVKLTKPKAETFTLPSTTLFPMQHAAALINAAEAGKTFFRANVYDGADQGSKVYLTSAVIGKSTPPGGTTNLASLKGADHLAGVKSWPMTVSYFDADDKKEDAAPLYELSYRFFENGVTTDLNIDYSEFAIKGTLKELTFLPESPCKPNAK